MTVTRLTVAKALLFAAAFVVFGAVMWHFASRAPVAMDDSDGLVCFRHSPLWFDEPVAYFYAKDHPAVFRWVNWAAVKTFRVDVSNIPEINRSRSYEWNARQGRLAPLAPVLFLRKVNVVTLLATLACLAWLSHIVFGEYLWGIAVAAPLALARTFGGGVGGWIFPDAYLAFFLALTIAVWVRFHLSDDPSRWWRVAVMGAILGLGVSAKYNAGLALLAYMAYLPFVARGRMRVWLPVAAGATASAVFLIVNPVMWQGGPVWWGEVLSDILKRRMTLVEEQRAFFGVMGLGRRMRAALPAWYLAPLALPLFAWVIRRASGGRWFFPVAMWAGFLVVGSLLTTHEMFFRFLMPIHLPATTLVMLCAISAYRSMRRHGLRDALTRPAEAREPA